MDELHTRARRAYEWARLRNALPWAVPAIAFGFGATGTGIALAVGLAVLVVGFRWAGRDLGRAVLPGLAVGLVGFAAPTSWEMWNASCCTGAGCSTQCLAVSIGGGSLAGLVLFRHARRSHATRRTILGTLAVASLATGIGCLQLGAMGLIGVAGLWAMTAPVLLAPAQAQQ